MTQTLKRMKIPSQKLNSNMRRPSSGTGNSNIMKVKMIRFRESDNLPSVTSESSSTTEVKSLSEGQDYPQFQFQVFPSTFSKPSPMLVTLQQKFEPSESLPSEKKIKRSTPTPDTERQHRSQNPSSKVAAKKVPPPTLPKPKFHPSFLTRQDMNVNYVMPFPTFEHKF